MTTKQSPELTLVCKDRCAPMLKGLPLNLQTPEMAAVYQLDG